MAEVMAAALARAGHECRVCPSAADALRALDEHGADVVVTDWKMPDMDGLALLAAVHAKRPGLPVILVTAHGTVPAAVAAMREGAFDYVTKPFDNDELRALVARALDLVRLERENRWLREEVRARYGPETIVAESAQSRALLDLVKRVAPSRAVVLIQGESGTGKELVARLLHFWSDRVGKPFVAVNVKAFAEGVVESELFGHERGAFTGAVAARAGCFERAHGGTLFLDEIGELGADVQAKLLRVVQDGDVLPVGGSRSRRVDVRLVTATNRVLRDEVEAGRFREDLYFRLNVIPIQLAPLRDRPDDVLPLARHFLVVFAAERGQPLRFTAAAEAALLAHGWPGNVRELENRVRRASLLAAHAEIDPGDLDLAGTGGEVPPALSADAERERDELLRLLAGDEGNVSRVADRLGISRQALYRRMGRLGIELERRPRG
jgi:two-component system response regulator AtoC